MNQPPSIPLNELVQTSAALCRNLKTVYAGLPGTRCLRQGRCCALLPETTFLEVLQGMAAMMSWPFSDRLTIIKKTVRYFFCNAVEISSCPFLQGGDCLIYPDRFFGCRAYGLWSREYYRDLADKNRLGKKVLQQQWERLGLSLPNEVLAFEVPYCSSVKPDPPTSVTDEALSIISDGIDRLSRDLGPGDREFRENYFSDLSFFLTAWQFGPREAVRLKYFISRDMIQKKDQTRLDQALGRVTDPFSEESQNL